MGADFRDVQIHFIISADMEVFQICVNQCNPRIDLIRLLAISSRVLRIAPENTGQSENKFNPVSAKNCKISSGAVRTHNLRYSPPGVKQKHGTRSYFS